MSLEDFRAAVKRWIADDPDPRDQDELRDLLQRASVRRLAGASSFSAGEDYAGPGQFASRHRIKRNFMALLDQAGWR